MTLPLRAEAGRGRVGKADALARAYNAHHQKFMYVQGNRGRHRGNLPTLYWRRYRLPQSTPGLISI